MPAWTTAHNFAKQLRAIDAPRRFLRSVQSTASELSGLELKRARQRTERGDSKRAKVRPLRPESSLANPPDAKTVVVFQ
jgi:hypothetical protein